MEATVKGQLMLGAKRYLREKYGDEGYEQFMSRQTPEDRQLWESNSILPISRVPARLFIRMYETFFELWGKEAYTEAAATVAQYDLSSIMKLFMKMGSPAFVAKRFPSIWRQYFNVGEVKIVKLEEHSLLANLVGARAYGPAGCEGALSWTSMALKYSGAKNLKSQQTQCCLQGADVCTLEYAWE